MQIKLIALLTTFTGLSISGAIAQKPVPPPSAPRLPLSVVFKGE